MVALRTLMTKINIGTNDKENGIWLPNRSINRVSGSTRTAHGGEGIHGNAYKEHVYNTLKNATTKQEFLTGLANLKAELMAGKVFPLAK